MPAPIPALADTASLRIFDIGKKMKLAMQLILTAEMQFQHIGNQVGYDSPSEFTTAFKKKYGKLPSDYRLD